MAAHILTVPCHSLWVARPKWARSQLGSVRGPEPHAGTKTNSDAWAVRSQPCRRRFLKALQIKRRVGPRGFLLRRKAANRGTKMPSAPP